MSDLLSGKTVIVTGSNTGIGYETALYLASKGARVILACRNNKLGEEARDSIISRTYNNNVVYKYLDLASLESVRAFVKDINKNEEKLNILVNNAGAGNLGNTFTIDGLHTMMQVNYFGPFLLTILLIDLLKRSAPSRIVNVSSILLKQGDVTLENLNNPSPSFKDYKAYSNSKLCTALMSNELARRLEGTGVTSNVLHPGTVHTNMFKANFSTTVQKAALVFIKPFAKNPKKGAETSIHAAVAADMEGVTGKYLENSKVVNMPRKARDEELAKLIWEETENLVRLTPEEKVI